MPSKTFTLIAALKLLISLARFTYADIAVLNPENKSVELFIDYRITNSPAIPENGMIGFLKRAQPPDACSKLEPPPTSNQNWFVLADRPYNMRCSNREKIQHAAEAGYKVIILYSPYDNHFQSPMYHSNTSIPAILVSHEDGNALAKKYLYQTGFKIYVTSDIPPNLSYYLLPFAIVIGVCLLLTISFMIFQLIRCVQERRKAQRHRLSKKYLKKLPLQKFEKGSTCIYYETCAICLDDYVDGEKIRILPCNHGYHMKCIDPWLTKNRRVCPVCKAKVTLPGMPESDDSDSDNDRRARSTQNEDANERTHLLPSSSSSTSRSHRSRYNLNRLIVEVRGDGSSSSAAAAAVAASSSRGQPNYNTASTSRYQPLDDTLSQPGPSTSSAPVISELSSQRGSSSGVSSGRSKRKRGHSRNVQVVAAEIAPLIAPPQLSINCDADVERLPSRSATIESNDSEQTSSSSQKRPSKRPSVDHIV